MIDRLCRVAFALSATVLGVAACTIPPAPTVSAAPDPAQAYNAAVARAAVLDPRNALDHKLIRIDRKAPTVTVVTWTTTATADKFYPIGRSAVGVDVWVTVSPQLRELCARFADDPDALRLRLQQLLGLPPHHEDRTFVVMDVRPDALIRPCPDPDPSTPTCTWDFPAGVSNKHKAWFAEQAVSRYRAPPDGYPWTRLGYTYDWSPDGALSSVSEFVVPKGTAVTVTGKTSTAAYCHPPQS